MQTWFTVVTTKAVMSLTEPLFFDTDCLSAFLWVNNQSLLAQLYPGRIIIPAEVYSELSIPTIPHLKARVDAMVLNGDAQVKSIQTETEEYSLYKKLTTAPDPGHVIIGPGEAAAIVMAKEQSGVLASNNLKDISVYVSEFGLQHKTTGDILKDAMEKGLITEAGGNQLWQEMLRKRRRLGYSSFSDYLKAVSIEYKPPYIAECGYQAMVELNESAEKNGVSNMTLDEINAEIEASRRERDESVNKE